jgi:hypothetical protein
MSGLAIQPAVGLLGVNMLNRHLLQYVIFSFPTPSPFVLVFLFLFFSFARPGAK